MQVPQYIHHHTHSHSQSLMGTNDNSSLKMIYFKGTARLATFHNTGTFSSFDPLETVVNM